jgi:CheY-like chemotaxis protein
MYSLPAGALNPRTQPMSESTMQKVVIMAEDNPVNVKVAQVLLKKLNQPFQHASDGRQLIELMKGQTFDLVLMDISMPVMDGYEATMRIRDGEAGEQNRNVPIVALTALSREDNYQTCMDMGMSDFVNKPVRVDTLRGILDTYLYGKDT